MDPAKLLVADVGPVRPGGQLAACTLPVCLACSSIGMILFKASQVQRSIVLLVAGYALEGVAFGLYPIALSALPMRVVCTTWSASSTVTSLLAGWLLYGEAPSYAAVFGCSLVVLGVFLVTL